MKRSLNISALALAIGLLSSFHATPTFGAKASKLNTSSHPPWHSVQPSASCPAGYHIIESTDCVAPDGTTFVLTRQGWYREIVVPGGIIIENVLTGAREYSDGNDFVHFVPLNCVWVAPRYQYVYPHGSRLMTTDGRLWDCNNGRFYYAGNAPTVTTSPAEPEPNYPSENESDDSGEGADGTIGRGTENDEPLSSLLFEPWTAAFGGQASSSSNPKGAYRSGRMFSLPATTRSRIA